MRTQIQDTEAEGLKKQKASFNNIKLNPEQQKPAGNL